MKVSNLIPYEASDYKGENSNLATFPSFYAESAVALSIYDQR